MPNLSIEHVSSPLKTPFAISRGLKTSAETVRVVLRDGEHIGRGECVPYARYGETVESVVDAIESVKSSIESGTSKTDLQQLLPAGAARCAVDCAMWDLEAKQTSIPVWQRAELPKPQPLRCTMSLSLDAPDAMAEAATQTPATLLKLKLGGPEDLDRIRAVHLARPDADLIVDGNEGLSLDDFAMLAEAAAQLGVKLIEQPFPAGEDSHLKTGAYPLHICADESVHTSADIRQLADRYTAINVKLDKAGGLTEAISMAKTAKQLGLQIMVGCMVGGSLSMAPALLVAGLADFVDLDGPLWLNEDIEQGLNYQDGMVFPASEVLWG